MFSQGNVCGLCGNFNGDGQDDFTTQGNLPTTSIIEFVDTWKASSNCPDSEADFDPCKFTPNRHTWAKIQCSIIKEDTFKDCHSQVRLYKAFQSHIWRDYLPRIMFHFVLHWFGRVNNDYSRNLFLENVTYKNPPKIP